MLGIHEKRDCSTLADAPPSARKTVKKKPSAIRKDAATDPQASRPLSRLPRRFPKRPLIAAPTPGITGMSQSREFKSLAEHA